MAWNWFSKSETKESNMVNETIDLLGLRAKDRVTGFGGIVASICFDLPGCVQAALSPAVKDDGSLPDAKWFDVQRLDVTDERVMNVPHFQAVARKPAEYTHGCIDSRP